MLRAIGMTRRQVRRMIRHESIVTALIGAALGIAVGIVPRNPDDAGAVRRGHRPRDPVDDDRLFVVATIVAGMLAAILPARRASRLNILKALQYE